MFHSLGERLHQTTFDASVWSLIALDPVQLDDHHRNRLDAADLTRPRDWTMMRAYGRSKLCNILFTRELASRLGPNEVVAACLHPGLVATGIGQRGGLSELGWKGAETPIFLATVPDAKPFHGGYVIHKTLAEPDPAARDAGQARRLWQESARHVGLNRDSP
jgi:NAD(P)-dependent dehydrogenase (short-subunit alcohol dehydrogenase family)